MEDIENALKALGIEPQEVKVYLALLELHESTATKIAERTGLGRVHMYQITNRLIEKGLASYIIKNNVKYFSASDPMNLLKDLQSKQEQLKNIMPVLIAKKNQHIEDTKAEIYRGREGINTILKTILRDKKPYYFMGGLEESCTLFKLESTIFVKRAEDAEIKGKILARKKENFFIGKNEQYRYIPENVVMTTTTWVWGNKTGIFVWKKPYYCILIDSDEIARSNKAAFDYLFNAAEKPSKADIKKRLLCD